MSVLTPPPPTPAADDPSQWILQRSVSTRRRMKAPERRAQLLAAARHVFGSVGFQRASMDAVARRAEVSKPVLYDHFPSKRDLYLALIDADLEAVRVRVSEALAAPTGNRERVRASFQAYFDFVDRHAPGFRLLMREAVGADRDVRAKQRSGSFKGDARGVFVSRAAYLTERLIFGRAPTAPAAFMSGRSNHARSCPPAPEMRHRLGGIGLPPSLSPCGI